MLETYKKKNRPWFYKPYLDWKWSPIWFGGDEFMRRTLVIGFPWTGQIVFPSRKAYYTKVDKQAKMLYIYFTTDEPVCALRTESSSDGRMNFDYSKDSGKLIGIEVFLEDLKEK